MSQYTIMVEDELAGIDGEFFGVSVAPLPEGVRAVQFNSSTKKGHIEYEDGRFPTEITSIAPYQSIFDSWAYAKSEKEKKDADPLYGLTGDALKDKELKLVEDDKYDTLISGISYNGYKLKLDYISYLMLCSFIADILSGEIVSVEWEDSKGEFLTIDASNAADVKTQCRQYVLDTLSAAKTKKEDIKNK